MFKSIARWVLVLCMLTSLFTVALAAPAAEVVVAVDTVQLDTAYPLVVDNTTYVSIYYVTQALRPDATLAWEEIQFVARGEDFLLTAQPGAHYLVVNGRYLYLPGGVLIHPDTQDIVVPVRVLCRALGATVGYENGIVTVTGGGTPLLAGDQFYNAEDLDLIARIIQHESGNQPLAGKIAVGNVILNRVASPSFPNTVYNVVYQKNQFPGATDRTPKQNAIIAAKLCMDGAVTAPGAYWFNGVGKTCWASLRKTHLITIGNHAFYG